MTGFRWEKELHRKGHMVLFSGQPFAMHCHHYNINLQKTLEDTLGQEGIELIYTSAEEANHANLTYLFGQYPMLKTRKSKVEMAATMFQNCGLGVLHFQQIDSEAGMIISVSSHHVTGWLAKHGRRGTPGCHFSRGWIAGAMAAIYERQPGYFHVTEKKCKMMRDNECVFQVQVNPVNAGSTGNVL